AAGAQRRSFPSSRWPLYTLGRLDGQRCKGRSPLEHRSSIVSSPQRGEVRRAIGKRSYLTEVLAPSGNRTPPLQVVNGGPLWVHVNGCAIVLSQDATQATMRSRTCLTEATLPHFSHRRTMMLTHSSIWFSLLVCCGVYRNRRRCRASRRPPRGTGGGPY